MQLHPLRYLERICLSHSQGRLFFSARFNKKGLGQEKTSSRILLTKSFCKFAHRNWLEFSFSSVMKWKVLTFNRWSTSEVHLFLFSLLFSLLSFYLSFFGILFLFLFPFFFLCSISSNSTWTQGASRSVCLHPSYTRRPSQGWLSNWILVKQMWTLFALSTFVYTDFAGENLPFLQRETDSQSCFMYPREFL